MRSRLCYNYGMKFKKSKYVVLVTLLAFVCVLIPVFSVRALTQSELDDFAQNGIMFYEPDEQCASTVRYSGNEITWDDLEPLEKNDKLKLIVETYGEYAMLLQKYYGIPWELPFAIMVFESQVGSDLSSDVNVLPKEVGDFNTMGMTLYLTSKSGDQWIDDPYDDPDYKPLCVSKKDAAGNDQYNCFNAYKTISQQLLGYFIYHGRNGHAYDEGMKLLTLDGYKNNFDEAISLLMSSYCTGGCYDSNIKPLIREGESTYWTGILDVIKEKGWMNSEELAEAWDIQPGGIATEKWGWGDIRSEIFEAYGEAGLPQEETSQFGAITSTGEHGTVKAASGGDVVLHSPENEWLDNVGLEGFSRDPVLNSNMAPYVVDDFAMVKGTDNSVPFAADAGNGAGLPGFIVLHWTAGQDYYPYNGHPNGYFCGDPNRRDDDGDIFVCPPHFVINTVTKEIFQLFPLSVPSAAVSAGSEPWDQYGIQIEVVGHGGGSHCVAGSSCNDAIWSIYNWSDDQWDYLAKLLIAISNETGIPLTSDLAWSEIPGERTRLTAEEMKSYIGVLGHQHIEGSKNDKADPGKMWDYIVPALERLGYSYNSASFDTCGNRRGNGTCRSLPETDGGCTDDGYTYFWQHGDSSWYSTVITPCTKYDPPEGWLGYGCGYMATAMAVTNVSGKMVTPVEIVKMAQSLSSVGFYSCGVGMYNEGPGEIINNGDYGLKAESISNYTVDAINTALKDGGMVITSVGTDSNGNGDTTFSSGGHFIVIRSLSSNGKWRILDSVNRPPDVNNTEWDPEFIVSQIRQHGSHMGWIVKKK